MSHKICVAPMMGVSDAHARVFWRLLSANARLYTEMRTADAVCFGDRKRVLDQAGDNVALQLGGSDPARLAEATGIAAAWGYKEVNLNVGCPSARVQSGCFGASLMRKPKLVADCVRAMQDSSPETHISVKCRLGVDDQSEEDFWHFLRVLDEAGVRCIIIHARKAWLNGISPKDNRDIPPLNYALARQAKQAFPHRSIILNGGLQSQEDIARHAPDFDGVMLGRAVWHNPYLLAELDDKSPARIALAEAYLPYLEAQYQQGVSLAILLRPLLGLFFAQAGGRQWRRWLMERVGCPADIVAGLRMMMRYASAPASRSA